MSSSDGAADTRRQSSRLKTRPLKILKDFSEADLSLNADGDGKKDVEMGPPALPAGEAQPASTNSTSTTKRGSLKRVREEESFRIGNDIGVYPLYTVVWKIRRLILSLQNRRRKNLPNCTNCSLPSLSTFSTQSLATYPRNHSCRSHE